MKNLAYKTIRGGACQKCNSSIIIAHGLLGNSANWITAARHLAEHKLINNKLHEIYLLDMRNHGESPHVLPHSNAAMASDIELFALQCQQNNNNNNNNNNNKEEGIVLIGHSMGGFAVMATMLRRANENALLLPTTNELNSRCKSGDYYGWEDTQKYGEEMKCVNKIMGFNEQQPLYNVLFNTGITSSKEQENENNKKYMKKNPRVKAAIIVDIAPSTRTGKQKDGTQTVPETLEAMLNANLSRIHSFGDGAIELERAGVRDKAMRDFLLTNIRLDSKTKEAKWRCNLSALRADYRNIELGLRNWFENADKAREEGDNNNNRVAPVKCGVPTLFVFGEKLPYNNATDRFLINRFFSNATQVEVSGAGHFVHYEKVHDFVSLTAPFLAKYL